MYIQEEVHNPHLRRINMLTSSINPSGGIGESGDDQNGEEDCLAHLVLQRLFWWCFLRFFKKQPDLVDDIGEELDDVGDAVIAPAVTIASDALEGLARTHLPGAFGELVATAIDDLEGEAVAFLGGTPSLEIAEA